MHKFKYILFIFIIICVCGCNSSYNLYFTDDKIEENILINVDSLDDKGILNRDFYPIHNNVDIVYEKKYVDNKDGSFLNLKYSFLPNEFLNSSSFGDCFLDRTFENNDDYYYLKMSNLAECYYGEGYDINIKTNNKVSLNNADEVNGNTYTWHVNSVNKNNLSIEIRIEKGIKNNTGLSNIIIFSSLFIILFICISIFLVYKKRQSSKDKF